MRFHILIHAPFEKPGVIESWAVSKRYNISSTHTYKNEKLPDASTLDFLVIMGGPQSPNEVDKYPYLRDEITLAKQAIEQNKVVLGVCLGAQIIGECLGAKTERSPNKEVGVYPIQLTPDGERDPIFKTLPKTFDVMHWHNDMPGMSKDSVILAHSEGCPRQVIRYSNKVYGLQCHLEMSAELVHGMVEHCAQDLKPGKYVQDATTLLAQNMTEINNKMIHILDHLAALVEIKQTAEKIG